MSQGVDDEDKQTGNGFMPGGLHGGVFEYEFD
jgi:hypothetical protein